MNMVDFKKLATFLLSAAVAATAGAYIDVQIMKTKFETILEDVKTIKTEIAEIKKILLFKK
jgi:hypothetical protein